VKISIKTAAIGTAAAMIDTVTASVAACATKSSHAPNPKASPPMRAPFIHGAPSTARPPSSASHTTTNTSTATQNRAAISASGSHVFSKISAAGKPAAHTIMEAMQTKLPIDWLRRGSSGMPLGVTVALMSWARPSLPCPVLPIRDMASLADHRLPKSPNTVSAAARATER